MKTPKKSQKKSCFGVRCSQIYDRWRKNYFYTYYIHAAAALFKAGKVKAMVASGDNSMKYYDEITGI